jgi:hypothetical protein
MNFKARLKALEQRRKSLNKKFRIVASTSGVTLNLANSTCRRTLAPNGSLTEIVTLDGSDQGLSDEDLERFIAGSQVQDSR